MSDRAQSPSGEAAFGDPTTAAFWAAARERRLLIQRCRTCKTHQFYPRPMCLACGAADLEWVEARGTGTIHSMTTMRLPVLPELPPPYVVALVELDEGPRLLTNIVGGDCAIGDPVRLAWRERAGAPPLPVFEPAAGGG